MRILELHASDIKRIRVVNITPSTNVIRVNGRNGSGKTSTLDSILWALQGAGSVDLVPVREGCEKGLIRLTLGEEKVEFVVTRTFNADAGTTKLTVEGPDGGIYPKPQQKLSELFGSAFSLDPQGFQRMSDKDRLETLRRIVKLDIDVDMLDRQSAADFEQRTQVNRDIESQKGRVATYASGVMPTMNVEPIDTNALLQQMQEASEADRRRAAEMRRRKEVSQVIDTTESQIKETVTEIARLERQIETMKAENLARDTRARALREEMNTWGPLPELVDVASIRQRVEEATHANEARAKQRNLRADLEKANGELMALEERRDALTSNIDDRKRMKSAALAAATYPVPGLALGESGVTFNGLPFEQASAAEQLRVSFAIAASLRPKLPVILIKDGSLLDDTSMRLLEELATAYDAQVWIERVGADDVGITLEAGEVVAVDGRPVDRGGEQPAESGV